MVGLEYNPFLTPLVSFCILVVFGLALYTFYKGASVLRDSKYIEDKEKRKLFESKGTWIIFRSIGLLLFVLFFSFWYFHVFIDQRAPMPASPESNYSKELDKVEPETRTKEELETDANEKKDKTGYLDDVGKQETYEEAQKESNDYIQKALERAKEREANNE